MAGPAPFHWNEEQQGAVTDEELLPLLAINITIQVNDSALISKGLILLAEGDCTLRDVAGDFVCLSNQVHVLVLLWKGTFDSVTLSTPHQS